MEEKLTVTLTAEDGLQVDYELLDLVLYQNKTYTVFYPTVPNATEVLICRVDDNPNDSDSSLYTVETDEQIIKEVYNQFKNKYNGKILFADNNQYN